MTSPLSYVEFLAVFVAVPAAALAAVVSRRTDRPRRVLAGLAVLVCIAVAYTGPWDSYLVGRGVWTYGEGVVAARILRVPVGEWLFVGLQTTVTGLWFYALGHRVTPDAPGPARLRTVGALGWLGVAALGAVLTVASVRTYYLGMILAWAGPVVAFLWAVGGPVVWRDRRHVAIAVAVPSLYLWTADRFAIEAGLWTISPAHSSGVLVFGLPVEEAVFFLVTNVLVVQGLLLFEWVLARADDGGAQYAVAGLVPVPTIALAASWVTRRWR